MPSSGHEGHERKMESQQCGVDAGCFGFRVRLEWQREADDASSCRRSWFYVDTRACATVGHVKRAMCQRLRVPCDPRDLRLFLDGFEVPSDEPVHVLQPEDHLVLRKVARDEPESEGISIPSLHRFLKAFQEGWPRSMNSSSPRSNAPRTDSAPTHSSGSTSDLGAVSKDDGSVDEESPEKSRKKRNEKFKKRHPSGEREEDTSSRKAGKHRSKRRKMTTDEQLANTELDDDDGRQKCHERSKKNGPEDSNEVSTPDRYEKTKNPEKKKRRESRLDHKETNVGAESHDATIEPVVPQENWDSPLDSEVKKKRNRRKHKNKNLLNEEEPSTPALAPSVPVSSVRKASMAGKHFRFNDLDGAVVTPNRLPDEREPTEEQNDKSDNEEAHSETRPAKAGEEKLEASSQHSVDPQEPSSQNDTITSVQIQMEDFASYPSLIGQPRINDIVAYKLLELSDNYTPEVTDYRVGKVTHSDLDNNVIIQYLSPLKIKVRRGKFDVFDWRNDLDDEEPEEEREEIVATATVDWKFVIDPKLIPNGGQ